MSPARSPRAPAVALGLALALFGAGCGAEGLTSGTASPSADSGVGLRIVTTVAPLTSIVANIAGDRATVTGIVPEGTNSHTFEPKPSVARLLATADIIVTNGLSLEEPTKDLAEANMRADATLVELGTDVLPEEDWIYDFSFPESGGKPNPHLWTDPTYALAYAQDVATILAEADPANADYFTDNLAAFEVLVDDFDVAMRAAFDTIPPGNKKLLTYHDAYAYFAETYDWEVIGAIQVSDFADPTAREVARLITQLRDEGVPAIFGSEVFPSPVLEQISDEAGVAYVDDLRDDDLPGSPGDPEHSWLGLMRFDFVTMTRALGGDPTTLENFEVVNVAPDTAEYPQ